MAKPRIEIKVSGIWRTITQPEVKVSGVWREVKTVRKKVGGVWETVFASDEAINVTSTLTGDTVSAGGSAIARFHFGHDGTIFLEGSDLEEFVQLNTGEYYSDGAEAFIGADYEIRETVHAGADWQVEAAVINTYIDLGAVREWGINRAAKEGIGTTSASGTFQIRDKATPFTVLTTFTFSISVERTA